jgi:hypothetical protein
VILFQPYDPLAKGPNLFLSAVIVRLERFLVDNASLLAQLLVLLGEDLSLLLHLAERYLLVVELIVEGLQLAVVALVLALHVLELLSRVAQDHHRSRDLLAELVKLLVSLFNLLI